MPDTDWLELQIEALFRCDAQQQLVCLNRSDASPAPLFFLGRSASGNHWRLHHALPTTLLEELAALLDAEPSCLPSGGPPVCRAAVRALLASSFDLETEYRGPAFRFPPEIEAPREVVEIDESSPGEAPCMARIVVGTPISVCLTARRGERAAEAGVETQKAFQRRGHATAVVSAWARRIQREGLAPLYSTTWDNEASRSVAARLGLIQYAENWHVSAKAN